MTSLAKPWAARSTILARMTSRYGDVYLRTLSASSLRSAPVNSTTYGLGRGIGTSLRECARPERGNATKIRHRIYEQEYLASLRLNRVQRNRGGARRRRWDERIKYGVCFGSSKSDPWPIGKPSS